MILPSKQEFVVHRVEHSPFSRRWPRLCSIEFLRVGSRTVRPLARTSLLDVLGSRFTAVCASFCAPMPCVISVRQVHAVG